MCGRSAFAADISQVVGHFGLERHPSRIEPRYNIAPSYRPGFEPHIVRVGEDGERELVRARWWFIPSFWNKPLDKLPTTFNARAEEAADKPFFRDSFRRRRCLMPATAWYEFRGPRGRKESYAFRMPDGAPFAFAGLWDRHIDSEHGEVFDSFCILTTSASPKAAPIHDRMPAVLDPAHYAQWLDPNEQDVTHLRALLAPWDRELVIYRTTGVGNDPRREGPECLEELRVDSALELPF